MLRYQCSLMLALCLLAVTVYASTLTNEMVVYLPMDEGQGDAADDESGNGNHAEVHNAEWVDGIYGSGLQLGGVDIWVSIPDDPTLNFAEGESFTLAIWTQMTGAWSGQGNIVAKYNIGSGTSQFYGMFAFTDDKIHTYTRDVGNVHLVELWSVDSINDGEWHHLALVRDAGNEVILYMDGDQVADAGDTTEDLTNTAPLAMGRHTTDQYYTGIVDELMLWRRALAAGEIQQVMQGNLLAVDREAQLATSWGKIRAE